METHIISPAPLSALNHTSVKFPGWVSLSSSYCVDKICVRRSGPSFQSSIFFTDYHSRAVSFPDQLKQCESCCLGPTLQIWSKWIWPHGAHPGLLPRCQYSSYSTQRAMVSYRFSLCRTLTKFAATLDEIDNPVWTQWHPCVPASHTHLQQTWSLRGETAHLPPRLSFRAVVWKDQSDLISELIRLSQNRKGCQNWKRERDADVTHIL